MRSPSIRSSVLHRLRTDEAIALVDKHFGASGEWKAPLLKYRLGAKFQADWKEEIGNWLRAAQEHGFLDPLLARLLKRTKRGSRSKNIDPNDKRHIEINAELAPAMGVHYLLGTGWGFGAWEPITGGDVDVDISMEAPKGPKVLFQVKAPDRLGKVVNRRVVEGENDKHVIQAVNNAAEQLPRHGAEPTVILVSAQRRWSLSLDPHCLVTHLIGSTLGIYKTVILPRSSVGKFFDPAWRHVSAVMLLDYVRGGERLEYACTVLQNPLAAVPVCPDWFPRARVCSFDGQAFHWIRGAPGEHHTLPSGTKLVEDE